MNERSVLYLEADEEIPSVVDRLREEKSNAVILVIPKASILLQSVVNLKLILRLSKQFKKDIAIVSHDPIGRNLAAQVGIPAYDSINAKMPLLSPIGPEPETDDILEVNMAEDKVDTQDKALVDAKKPVKINHFQENQLNDVAGSMVANTQEDNKIQDNKLNPGEEPSFGELIDQKNKEKVELDHKNTKLVPGTVNPQDSSGKVDKPVPPPIPGKQSVKKKRRFGFVWAILAALIVIIAGAVMFYPKATLTLTVKGEDFKSNTDITIKPDQKKVDLAGSTIPATQAEVVKEKSQKVTATGTKNIGQKASGTINFYNSYSTTPQSLPSGTKLSKDDKSFLTTSDITIPGATTGLNNGVFVTTPGQTTGPIEATSAGEDYNVSPGKYTITDFDANKQSKIYGQSDKALTGGSSEQITVVSQSDIDKAKDSMVQALDGSGKDDLTKQFKGLILLDKAIKYDVVSVKPDAAVGDKTDSFNLDVKVKVSGLAFDNSDFRSVFLYQINQKIPDGKELILKDDDQISTDIKSLADDGNSAVVTGNISTKIGPEIKRDELSSIVTGKTEAQAVAKAKAINGVESAHVNLNPNLLFGHLPLSAKQIEIKVKYK